MRFLLASFTAASNLLPLEESGADPVVVNAAWLTSLPHFALVQEHLRFGGAQQRSLDLMLIRLLLDNVE
jgi:hypothetical protein